MISQHLQFVKPPRANLGGFLHKLTLFAQCDIIKNAESRGGSPPKKGGISMEIEQLVLYIILAYILLEIFKTIKK